MAEEDIVELLWKNGQIVRSSQTQRRTSDKSSPPPPPILRGSGSGGGGGQEENAPLPLPQTHQNLFIQEDEMTSWLHHYNLRPDLLYSGVSSAPPTHPQIPVSLPPPPPPISAPYDPPAARRAENFSNFSRLTGRVEAGPWIPVVRESTQVGSSATPSSSASESSLIPATVSPTFAVPGKKEKAVAITTVCEIAATSSSGDSKTKTESLHIQPATEREIADDRKRKEKRVCDIAGTSSPRVSDAETEAIQIQPATELEIADDRKRKEREETIGEIEETREARGSTARKRSRTAEMHNLSERRRREKINEKMKAVQELIPRCNKSDKASVLDDAIEYVKSLQMQVQMMSMGGGTMPMMYPANMQQFVAHMSKGAMGMNRPPFIPFPRQAHMAGLDPSYPVPRYPFPNSQASDPSRVHLPSQQPNQPQFPAYMNPYSQSVGLQQMQQPPPMQNQTTSQLSFSQASSSKEPEDQDNPATG